MGHGTYLVKHHRRLSYERLSDLMAMPTMWSQAISWGLPGIWSDILAVRSENKGIVLLDLTPIHMTDIELPYMEGFGSSLSWTPCGDFLARVTGESIFIVDSRCAFTLCAKIGIPGNSFRRILFSPIFEHLPPDKLGQTRRYNLAGIGMDGRLYLIRFEAPDCLRVVSSVIVEENLWALAWSAGTTARKRHKTSSSSCPLLTHL